MLGEQAETIGVSESELVREAVFEGLPLAIKKLAARKKREAEEFSRRVEMVRGGGFEPPTPTVSRERPRLKNGTLVASDATIAKGVTLSADGKLHVVVSKLPGAVQSANAPAHHGGRLRRSGFSGCGRVGFSF